MEKSEEADKGKLSCFVHISGCLGATLGPLGLRMHGIAPLNPAELGQYQSWVVGGDTGSSVPYTGHIFDSYANRETLCFLRISGCLGAAIGSPWVAGACDAPLGPAEVELDQSRVVGGNTGPSVPHTSHIFDGYMDKEKFCNFRRIPGYLDAAMGSP